MDANIQLKKIDHYQYGEAFKLIVIVDGREYSFDISENGYNHLKEEFKAPPVKSGQFEQDIHYII